jgi:hypothetical protein
MKKIPIKTNFKYKGAYTVTTLRHTFLTDLLPRKFFIGLVKKGLLNFLVIRKTAHQNLIMKSDTYGINLILRALSGDTTYGIEIDSAGFGTGTTPPTDADEDLETPVLVGIIKANAVVGVSDLTLDFFTTDAELANGTYTEFAIYIGTQLFARSIIDPSHTKGTLEDTLIEYLISADNS